jgi:type IX secretion system PorP/SprF family membrane protein
MTPACTPIRFPQKALAPVGWAAFLLVLVLQHTATGQQIPQYTLFSLNPYAYNSAFAGSEGTLVATGVYRKQWSGLEGAPEMQHINAHLPFPAISSGAGLRLENNIIGAHRVTQAVVACNYQMGFGDEGQIAIGVGVGYLQYSLDGNRLRAPEGVYPTTGTAFSHNDPRLPEGVAKAGTFIAETGVRLSWGGWEAGIAAQPVFAPLLSTVSADTKNAFQVRSVRHYNLYLSRRFALGEQITLRPAALVKTDGVTTQMEIQMIARWRDQFFVGGGYRGFTDRARESAPLLVGVRLNEKLQMAYGFDMQLGPLSGVQRGSHELLLRYALPQSLGAGKLPPVIYNPRFF